MTDAGRRRGYTAIEMLTVLTVIGILASIAAVGALPAIRRARLDQGAGELRQVSFDASLAARTGQSLGASEYYGVRISGGTDPNYVAVIYGTPGSVTELQVRRLNDNLQFFRGDDPLDENWDWFYQYGSGYPWDPGTAEVTSVGTGNPGTNEHLSLRTLDQRFRRAIAIYEIGIMHAEPF